MKIRQQFLFILIFALFLLGNAGHFMLPQVFTSYSARAFSSDTKANLHNLYLGCKAYWADEGSPEICTVKKVSSEEYGYVQSQEVKIYGSGTENDFCAVAWHQGNSMPFEINYLGSIVEKSEFIYEKLNKNPPDKIRVYEKLLPRHFVYYSWVLILPLMVVKLTSWAGGYPILRRKRKSPSLIQIGTIIGSIVGVIFGWLFIVSKDFYIAIFVLLMILIIVILAVWARAYLLLRRKRKSPSLIHIGITVGIIFGWLFIALVTSGFAGSDYSYYVGFGEPFGLFLGIPVIYSISRAFSLIGWGNQIERVKDLPDYLKNHRAKKLKKSGICLLGVVGVLLALNFIYSVAYTKYKENYRNQSVKFSEEIQSFLQTDPSSFQKMCQQPLR